MSVITIVSGFGRCGTSLVMQMLEAGGMPMTGIFPSFEVPECGKLGTIDKDWLEKVQGCAIKVLDPHRVRLPDGFNYRVIWLSRDHREQAKSQAKFLSMMCGFPVSRGERRAIERSYSEDKPAAHRALLSCKPPGILNLRFESILARPEEMAEQISHYCGPLDIKKMATAVHPRSPMCAPGMDMELSLIQERRAA